MYFEEAQGVPQYGVLQIFQQAHTILGEFVGNYGGNVSVGYAHNDDSLLYPLAEELRAVIPGYAPRNTGFSVVAKVELPREAVPAVDSLCARLHRELNITPLSIPTQ